MPRKVIALQTVVVNTNDPDAPGGSYWQLMRTALCDDGSMWWFGRDEDWKDVWHRLPDVPQDR